MCIQLMPRSQRTLTLMTIYTPSAANLNSLLGDKLGNYAMNEEWGDKRWRTVENSKYSG